MRYLAILIFVIISILSLDVYGQRVYKDVNGAFILDASGLPANCIKSNAEVENSKYQSSGITKRHTALKGNGSNPNVNFKVSPKIAIANHDVLTFNNVTGEYEEMSHWMGASGWEDVSADSNLDETGAPVLRGCAAYRGSDGTDNAGTWRLPTARELTLIWSMKDKLMALGYTALKAGYYWSSSEANNTKAYVLIFPQGSFIDPSKWNKGRMRCVRDL